LIVGSLPAGKVVKLPKIHLRDLFWLTLVVAICCGWAMYHRRTLNQAYEMVLDSEIELFNAYKDGRDWRLRAEQLQMKTWK
jgi:hypothetical protein